MAYAARAVAMVLVGRFMSFLGMLHAQSLPICIKTILCKKSSVNEASSQELSLMHA
jgi:hypothetical protein